MCSVDKNLNVFYLEHNKSIKTQHIIGHLPIIKKLYFQKQFLENSSYVELRDQGSVLHIVFALPQHSGNYECEASNRAGLIS